MRGVLAGLMTGLFVSGLVLGTASVLVDLADTATLRATAPEADTVELPPGSAFDAVREDRAVALPDTADSPTPRAASRVPAPAPDDTQGLTAADTASAGAPDTGAVTTLGAPPSEAPGAGRVEVQSDSPVWPSPQALAPGPPGGEARPLIATEPSQPPSPDPGESGAALGLDDTPTEQERAAGENAIGTDESAVAAEVEAEAEADADREAVPGSGDAARPAADAIVEPVAPDEGAPVSGPRRIVPSGTIEDRAEGVSVNRLPRIGDIPETEPETEGAAPPPDAETDPRAATGGALVRNAVAFEAPGDRPLMAIVLLDEGQDTLGLEALGAFPYPLSFAIPADRADAAEVAARYREAGFEVLIAADLPETATAADTEIAMQAWLAAIPQAIAVLEGTGTGLQSSREAAAQLAPILGETGHGIVMLPSGLNTAQKLIAREGVPSATLFRDFDGQGQDAGTVRRFLDQAAMRAAQQNEGVIMLGRVRPDTISALLLWGLQDRVASVALAPVSAVLTSE